MGLLDWMNPQNPQTQARINAPKGQTYNHVASAANSVSNAIGSAATNYYKGVTSAGPPTGPMSIGVPPASAPMAPVIPAVKPQAPAFSVPPVSAFPSVPSPGGPNLPPGAQRMARWAQSYNASIAQPHPAGPSSPPVSAFPTVSTPASAHLPDWARQHVRAGGGNPQEFVVKGGMLMKGQPQLAASAAAEPTAPAPAPTPAVGVQGAAAAKPQVGVNKVAVQPTSAYSQPVDPFRQRLVESANMAANAARNSQQKWFYPPGTGVDPVFAPNLRNEQAQAATEAVNRYDLTRATLAEKDPATRIGMLRAIAADPKLRNVYLAGQGADPATLAAFPKLDEQAQGTPGAAVADENAGLLDRLRQLKSVPGASEPTHPQHIALQDWVNKRFANPADWDEETYVPPDPNGFVAPSFLTRPAGMVAAAVQGLTGIAGPHSAGTGLSWPQNFRDRSEQQALLNQIGIRPPGPQ